MDSQTQLDPSNPFPDNDFVIATVSPNKRLNEAQSREMNLKKRRETIFEVPVQ